MNDVLNEIDRLFADTDSDFQHSASLEAVAGLPGFSQAVVLFLADEKGRILAVSDPDLAATMPRLGDLVGNLSDGLRQDDTYIIDDFAPSGTNGSPAMRAFGVRLGEPTGKGTLGGVGELPEDAKAWLADTAPVLRVCGEMAWLAIEEEARSHKLQTQVRHLHMEEETLKAAHTEAYTTAVEEQAKRLQGEREKLVMEQDLVKVGGQLK